MKIVVGEDPYHLLNPGRVYMVILWGWKGRRALFQESMKDIASLFGSSINF